MIIAQLHSRTQFIGEMLNELRAAHDSGSRLHTWDVLKVAKERYGFGWTSAKQIDSRRGWLQSAGLVSVPSDKQFQVTPAGHALLERLELHVPTAEAALEQLVEGPASRSAGGLGNAPRASDESQSRPFNADRTGSHRRTDLRTSP